MPDYFRSDTFGRDGCVKVVIETPPGARTGKTLEYPGWRDGATAMTGLGMGADRFSQAKR